VVIAVVIGGHTVGHVHKNNSGFFLVEDPTSFLDNGWDSTPDVFDNGYFQKLINKVSFEII
jgi:catalase (peroxidase I)